MDPALQELLEFGESTDEVAVVLRLREAAELPPGLNVVARMGPIVTARIERAAIVQLYGHPSVISLKAPRWLVSEYGPLIDRGDAENVDVADSDQRRPDDLTQTGRGCVIALIDWGCDFAHPDFIDENGVSRVLALWDQRAGTFDGNPYGYGRVLRQEALTAAIHADDPYRAAGYHPARSDTGIGAHGTHVMSIAAGNGRGGGPLGIAPEASLIFVHLGAPGWEKAGPLGDSSNLLEAIDFVVREAGERPLVLNMSIGRHAGPHDGSTLIEQALDWLVRARPATAVVQSTGNYYARNVHSAGQLRNGETDELRFEVHTGDTTPNELEIWYSGRDVFQVELIAPDGNQAALVAQGGKAPIVIDGNRVGTLYHRARDPNNGDHHINLFQYPNAPTGVWRVRLSGEDVSDGRYHAWLERDPGCRVCQALFSAENARYTGTTGSICNGLQTIAVGAYDGHDPDRRLAPFSSSGPTRDGRVRPLLLAPGVRVLAARSHPRKGTAALLTRMSGTSMAAPHVAGTIALMLQASGKMNIVQIRRALFESLAPVSSDLARDRHRIGFGVLDIGAAVRRAAELGNAAATATVASARDGPRTSVAPAATGERTESDPDSAEAEPPTATPPSATEETTMHSHCCGEACKTCTHCQDHACETCPCCHPGASTEAHETQAAAATSAPSIQVVPSPFGSPETLEAPFQVVPSPLLLDEAMAEAGAGDEAGEPQIQTVPSPFNMSSAGEHAFGPPSTAYALEDTEVVAGEAESAYSHPVDAAEALVEAGVDDSTEFVTQCLAASGRAWPPRSTVRSLFDDLCNRTTSARRLYMDRYFEVIGRPDRPLSAPLQAGDIVIRRGEGGFAYAAFVAHPWLYNEHDARAHGLLPESPWPGLYAHVVESGPRPQRGQARFARRVCAADGTVLPDTLVTRARAPAFAHEFEAAEAEIEAEPDSNMRWLQAALNRTNNAGLVVDGLDGPATRDAIRRYQAARGLQVDGIAGPQTLQSLHSDYGGTTPTSYPPTGYTPPYTPPPSYTPPRYGPPPPRYPPPPYRPPPPGNYRPPVYTPPRPYPPPTYTPPPPPTYTPPPPPPTYQPPAPPGEYRPPGYTPPRPPYVPPRPPQGYRPPGYAPPPNTDYGICRTLERFGYDSAALPGEHQAVIGDLARRIVASRAAAVTITGYASPEGSASYNLALGQRRAEAVAAALRQALDQVQAGASTRIRFDLRSEGEARQVSADGPSNRRVKVCYAEPRPVPVPPRRYPPVPPRTQLLTRHSVETPEGQAMLQRYEEAVRRMMALPASNPSSWVFQWYTHAVRNDRTKAGELNAVFGSAASPARTLADRTWNTCRAHFSSADEAFFLPWHRMYVYYFERICRRVLGDETFTLPYWNYSTGSSVLPAPFRNPSSPLFRTDRNAGPNQGRPIDQGQPPRTLSAERALALPNFTAPGDEPGFNDVLDRDPHGTVHDLIGTDRGMGVVAWAAGDPIFWLHHCNIDRIWASWNNAGRRNPSDAAWLSRRFTFADENGREVNAIVSDHTSTTARGYRYDRFEPMPASARAGETIEADEPTRARRSAMATRSTVAPSGGIPLSGNAIKVSLGRPVRDSEESDEAGQQPRRMFLVLRNYRASVQPGVIYHLYLALPPGRSGQAAQQHYVGPLSFFDAVPHAGHGGNFVGKTARFDVTDVAARLRSAGQLDGTPSVTIAPAGQPAAAAQPVIGEISLVEQ